MYIIIYNSTLHTSHDTSLLVLQYYIILFSIALEKIT